jgi:hypothetical protein
MFRILLITLLGLPVFAFGQSNYWQQKADYVMEIDMQVDRYQYDGKQTLTYFNNSPDTIDKVFYHLFFNAFQPGSMMDVRSRTISDPDPRVSDRISNLKENEIGFIRPSGLKQDGKKVDFEVRETILEVKLKKPILPGQQSVFEMEWQAQVPLQIRRSGRDNREGIALSMAQWYPRICGYDEDGWHPNPYVGREFYGPFGDFDVKITIDSSYVLGGTGYLQNPLEIGHGYEAEGETVKRPQGNKLTWHFIAPQVIDFMWAADPEYNHFSYRPEGGPMLHFFFKGRDSVMVYNWARLVEFTAKTFEYASARFGKYPYDQFSVIQGGDGGMEYPMGTLITGRRKFGSLVGVSVHEIMHSWYQGILASNEARYSWFDEGFTQYSGAKVMEHLFPSGDEPRDMHQQAYAGYFEIAGTPAEDPMSTHADHFQTNDGYGMSTYSKGEVYLHQLSYIVGQDVLDRSLKRYFNTWKFRHPTPADFLRIVERESGMVLDWYNEYFVNSTATIDYAIRSVEQIGNKTSIALERIGRMPMPVEVVITTKNGDKHLHYMPLAIMHGAKKNELSDVKVNEQAAWPWTNPTYTLETNLPVEQIVSIEIDPSFRMADIDRSNNLLLLPDQFKFKLNVGKK